METKQTTKKFKVSLTRYPEEFEVEATSCEDAYNKALDKINYSVWDSEVEEMGGDQ